MPKPNKIHILFRRAVACRLERQLGKQSTETQNKCQSLILAAPSLLSDIRHARTAAQRLFAAGTAVPRPTTPPNRDELFQRPSDAPESQYEKAVRLYNQNVETLGKLREHVTELKGRVARFKAGAKELAEEHATKTTATVGGKGKKVGKAEHDLESLENAAWMWNSASLISIS